MRFLKKPTVLIFLFTLIILAVMLAVSLTQVHTIKQPVFNISQWFNHNRIYFIGWQILIILAIFLGWGYKIDREARNTELPKSEIKRLKRFRYWLIGFVLLINLILIW